jgi:excisionase family DNA binding protein
MLLARKGYRVLVVDRAMFPSDTLSTHMIHGPGVAALQRWGLLNEVAGTGCPPIETYSFDLFRVNPKTVTRWAKAGRISAVRTIGGHRRFRTSEVEHLLEDATGPAVLEG